MKILVAEDDRLTRRGLVEVLEAEGYETVEAADGAEALALFDQVEPDVVCLDIMMPEIDGYEVCRRLRARPSDVPVLFISAKYEEIDPKDPRIISTVHGVGYRYEDDPHRRPT